MTSRVVELPMPQESSTDPSSGGRSRVVEGASGVAQAVSRVEEAECTREVVFSDISIRLVGECGTLDLVSQTDNPTSRQHKTSGYTNISTTTTTSTITANSTTSTHSTANTTVTTPTTANTTTYRPTTTSTISSTDTTTKTTTGRCTRSHVDNTTSKDTPSISRHHTTSTPQLSSTCNPSSAVTTTTNNNNKGGTSEPYGSSGAPSDCITGENHHHHHHHESNGNTNAGQRSVSDDAESNAKARKGVERGEDNSWRDRCIGNAKQEVGEDMSAITRIPIEVRSTSKGDEGGAGRDKARQAGETRQRGTCAGGAEDSEEKPSKNAAIVPRSCQYQRNSLLQTEAGHEGALSPLQRFLAEKELEMSLAEAAANGTARPSDDVITTTTSVLQPRSTQYQPNRLHETQGMLGELEKLLEEKTALKRIAEAPLQPRTAQYEENTLLETKDDQVSDRRTLYGGYMIVYMVQCTLYTVHCAVTIR